ncbi:MAG: EamA family transporter [Lachnospiraceae bacterium]
MTNFFNLWWVQVLLYLFFSVIFTQCFKITTKTSRSDGALTVLLEIICGLSMLFFVPCFEMKWSTDIRVYLLTGLAIVFYCIKDRLITTVRKNLEASSVNILEQVNNVFLVVFGLIIFKEPFLLNKIIGASLIIISNIIIFYQKGAFHFNINILLGVIANLAFSVALCVNIGLSSQFNIGIYEMTLLLIPALLISIFEKIKPSEILLELKIGNKPAIFITGLSWSLIIMTQLRALQLGSITTVAPLCAVSVILNVFAGYIFLQERSGLFRKMVAAFMIIFSIILIK